MNGDPLYDYAREHVEERTLRRPQCVDLLEMLEEIFDTPQGTEPDVLPLKKLLLSLVEDGQRHTGHGHRKPQWGVHPCARRVKSGQRKDEVYCRYRFPSNLFLPDAASLGIVTVDEYRPELRNLLLARNDSLLNNMEVHLLLCNLGNIDWRPLINLWSVLEYLTKYTSKAGKGSRQLGKVLSDVLDTIHNWEEEDGLHDLWRRAIMKFYSQIIGGRDYSLLETVHFGIRLPST